MLSPHLNRTGLHEMTLAILSSLMSITHFTQVHLARGSWINDKVSSTLFSYAVYETLTLPVVYIDIYCTSGNKYCTNNIC